MKLREAEVLKRLEHLPVLIVNGSGDTLAGLEEAKWNYEASRSRTERADCYRVGPRRSQSGWKTQ